MRKQDTQVSTKPTLTMSAQEAATMKSYDLNAHPKSSTQLNAFFKQQGLPNRAVQGRGYIYWIDDMFRPSVYTCYISNMTFGQWLDEAKLSEAAR